MSTPSGFARDLSPRAWRHFLVDVMPPQGAWSEEQYLAFTDHTNRLIEFTDGCVEPLPTPADRHQNILEFLYEAFVGFSRPRGGKVLARRLARVWQPPNWQPESPFSMLKFDVASSSSGFGSR